MFEGLCEPFRLRAVRPSGFPSMSVSFAPPPSPQAVLPMRPLRSLPSLPRQTASTPVAQLRFASLTTGRLAASTHKASFSIPSAARLPAAKADFEALRKTFCAWPLRGPERPVSEGPEGKGCIFFSQCSSYRRCGVRGLGIVLFARWIPRFSARLSARFLVASFFYATVLPKSSMPWLRPFCADCADR